MYSQPALPYDYGALAPVISEEQLKLHYDKHHAAYVKGANDILLKLDKARREDAEVDMKAICKEFNFNYGGLTLHQLFWPCMAPTGKGGGKPGGRIADYIEKDFGTFERFKKEFTQVAIKCEGSGWASLNYCGATDGVQIFHGAPILVEGPDLSPFHDPNGTWISKFPKMVSLAIGLGTLNI